MKSERQILMVGVLMIAALILTAIFVSDWFFGRTLLTET